MKIILVTGASRGIGAATALLAGKKGYHVIVNYLNSKTEANQLVSKICASGGTATAIQANVTSETEILDLFSQIDKIGHLTDLVNNAGILEPQMKLSGMTGGRLDRIFKANVIGPFLCTREAIKRMSTRLGGMGGSIVNVSSQAAITGAPGEYIDYAASKGALDSFTRGLAREVASEGIRVNGVRPAYIHTDIHAAGGEPERIKRLSSRIPLKRGGKPEEVAEAILWLLSDRSSYSTGTFIEITGGM